MSQIKSQRIQEKQKMKRLGLLVRADNTGLGYQTRDYYKHLKPHKVMLIDISSLNGNKQHYDWYENAQIVQGFPSPQQIVAFLDGLDVVLTAETFYNPRFCELAKAKKVKTINVENPEFYDHIKYPGMSMPDVMILPSIWKEKEIRDHAESKGVKVYQIHHPIDRELYPFKIQENKKFMHLAGKPAAQDRNGTWDFLQACPDGVVTTQSDDLARHIKMRYRQARVVTDIADPLQVYSYGNILVLPRKYGGNCLPLNEALSLGMPVIMPDIEPNNNILPKEWLVEATVSGYFEPRTKVDIYQTDITALKAKLDWFKNCNIEEESIKANAIADSISWEALLPKYIEVINE